MRSLIGRTVVLAGALAAAGCVASKHPLSDERDSVPDVRLLGRWEATGEVVAIERSKSRPNVLEWVHEGEDGSGGVARYSLYTTTLAGARYASLEWHGESGGYLLWKYDVESERLAVRRLEERVVRAAIQQGVLRGEVTRGGAPNAGTGPRRLPVWITASPAEIAAYLAAPPADPWGGPAEYVRVPVTAETDPEVAGARCLDQASRWIAGTDAPPTRARRLRARLTWTIDDGTERDERRVDVQFEVPDALRVTFEWGGKPSTFLVTGERAFMIRDETRVTDIDNSPAMRGLLPRLLDLRLFFLRALALVSPSSFVAPAAQVRFLGQEADPRARGDTWLKVARKAPGEGDVALWFGSAPRADGRGVRAAAPERAVFAAAPGSRAPAEEYVFEGWAPATDRPGATQGPSFPRTLRRILLGPGPERKETLRVTIESLETE